MPIHLEMYGIAQSDNLAFSHIDVENIMVTD